MRLLVSVRSAAEAVAALDGAAHIVDAKEPARGPLGAVEPAVLAAILDQVPANQPVQRRARRFHDGEGCLRLGCRAAAATAGRCS